MGNFLGRATSAQTERPPGELTERVEEVLRLIAWGLSNVVIAMARAASAQDRLPGITP